MATLPKSQVDPGAFIQDPKVLAWLRQNVIRLPQEQITRPSMERFMQLSEDPPAGLNSLPAPFYAPGYVPMPSAPRSNGYQRSGFPEEASLQGGEGSDTLAGGKRSRSRYTLTPRDVEAINNTSARLGIRPDDLTAVMMYETIGTMNPDITGGKGGNYQGLIQFGPTERKAYGYRKGMSFAEQVEGPVYNYLKGRGLQPGDDVGRLYRTINGGNRNAKLWKNDGNGTIAQHIERIKSDFLPRAQQTLAAIPTGPDVGAIMDVASLNTAPSSVPDQRTAAQGYAPDLGGVRQAPAQTAIADLLAGEQGDLTPEQIDFLTMTDEAGNYINQPPPPSAPPTPQMPPQWADATGFPIDEALTGRTGQDVLAGGPRMDPRRQPPGAGPIPPDMGAMLSSADVLNAGPRLDPRRAPPATGPVGPTTAQGVLDMGPRPRPSNVPDPRMRPERGEGIPDPRMRPDINDPSLSFNAPPYAGGGPTSGPPPAPYSPMVAGRPELPAGPMPGASGMSAAMGGPPSRTGDMSAAMGGPPAPSLPPFIDPAEQDARMAAFESGMESDRVARDLYARRREMQAFAPDYGSGQVREGPIAPPPAPYEPMVAGRPEFPGAIQPPRPPAPVAEPLPPGPPTRQAGFDPRMTPPRTGTWSPTPRRYDVLSSAVPPPALPEPANPAYRTGEGAPSAESWGDTGTFMTDDRPAPLPALPDPMAGRFDDAFAPSPGMIADLPGAFMRQQSPPPPDAQAGINSVFGAPPAPAAVSNLAIPFAEVPGIGAPPAADFSNRFDPPGASPPPSISMGDFNERFAGGSVVDVPQPGSPGVVQGQMPTPEGAMDIRPPAQGGPAFTPQAAPPPAPRQTDVGAQRQRSGIVGRVLGGLLGGPLGALGGGLLGGGGIFGGNFGFGQGASVTPMGNAFSSPYMQPNGQMGTTNVQRVQSGNMQGTMWNRNGGGSVGYVTDPFTGAMIHSSSGTTF